MVGLPCAGKTTLARRIERDRRALRLTPDEWQIRLFGTDRQVPGHDARHDLVEAVLWDLAARVLELGVDVILDFGFWTRAERENFRGRAMRLRARSEVHFADASEAELLSRVRERNGRRPEGTFVITEEQIVAWAKLFEPPTPDELRPREV
jgi:predicted kinase